jgi:hypothetical protein
MLSVAPASVLVMGLLGMFIVAYSVLRMTIAERRAPRTMHPVGRVSPTPTRPASSRSGATV